MKEEDLKKHWYSAYNDALKLLKNSNRISEKDIAEMTVKYGNTVFNRLFCLVVWNEIKRIRNGNPSMQTDQYSGVIADAWKLFKKYSDPNDSEEYWDSLVSDMHAVYEKHQKNQLCLNLLVYVTLEEIERIWRESK